MTTHIVAETVPDPKPPQFTIPFRFDAKFVADGLKRDWAWRAFLMLAALPVIALLLYLLYGAWSRLIMLSLAGAMLGVALASWWMFRLIVRRTVEFWQKLSASGVLTFELDDDGIAVRTDGGATHYAWGDFLRVRQYSDVWLLEIVRNTSLFFPVAQASAAARAFLLERCREAGVRV